MFMDQIAAMSQYPMRITWITCMTVIYIISTMTIGMNAPWRVASSMRNTITNMDPIVVMSQYPMATTLITFTMVTYTPLTATTGTNTKPVILVSIFTQNR